MGGTEVGKTAYLRVLIEDKAHDGYSCLTIGSDCSCKSIEINEKKILTRIRDHGGCERFQAIYKNYIKQAQAFLLIYDITNKSSFLKLKYFIEIIEDNKYDDQIIYKILIGNKCDFKEYKRQITFEEGKEFADSYGMKFFETSTTLNINVKESFLEMTKDLINIYEQQKLIDENKEKTKIKISSSNSSGLFSFFTKKIKTEDTNKEKEKELKNKNIENDLEKEKKINKNLVKRIKELEKENELKLINMENDLQKEKKRMKFWKKE